MHNAQDSARSRHTLFLLALLVLAPSAARAQQPFYTDDTDVTPKGKLHFEFSNQFDFLQRSSFPNRRQNTASFELGYGLFEGVEVLIETPLLAIFNAQGTTPRTGVGVGDTNLSVKYNFRQERESSRLPAMSVNFSVELPTGDTARQLGSGVADFSFNGIAQKSLTEKNKAAGQRRDGLLGQHSDGCGRPSHARRRLHRRRVSRQRVYDKAQPRSGSHRRANAQL